MSTQAQPAPFDGARLLSWARRSVAELERRRVEINELNVFPVPDADTGSNMAHTMHAAVAEAEKLPGESTMKEVAEALAKGSMRGARGNSGVVLSQVIRAVAQSVGEGVESGAVIADALNAAVRFVDRAISEPVEGTVVTVLGAAAVAADETRTRTLSIDAIANAALEAAQTALARTPSQLEVLRQAGVVDAGGTGLVVLLEQLVGEIAGTPQTQRAKDEAVAVDEAAIERHAPATSSASAELEVMFFYTGDVAQLEAQLSPLGNSLVISRADDNAGKVHIHSLDAGKVIETAMACGTISDVSVEVLPAGPVTQHPQRLIVALTPGGSLADLYTQAGAVTVPPGEAAVAKTLALIRRSPAHEVILLPNGLLNSAKIGSIEKSARAFNQTVTVLPTVRLVSGIAALAVHDANQPLQTVAFSMAEAAGEMRTAALQRVESPGLVQGGAVSEGDLIMVSRGQVTNTPADPVDALIFASRLLLEQGGEQISILYRPEEITSVDTEALSAQLGVEVMAYPADGLNAVAEIGVE